MVAAFVRDRSPLDEVRRVSGTETGYDPGVWADLGGQLGLTGLLVPAGYGGAGCGLPEAGVVLQELGRGLAERPLPVLRGAGRDRAAGQRGRARPRPTCCRGWPPAS